ncbi:MAG: J domain-containing protein [Syntrophaceae bacterium]|nr:J domain-containing protein [Syntrophaceae bacterium]
MQPKDYYEILGLAKNAGFKQVRDAYRKLALQYHPDRNQNDQAAAERMKEINEAYAVLSDSQKRKEYDTMKEAYGSSAYNRYRQTHTEQDIFRGSDIQQIFEEMSRIFGFRSFDDIFRESYGSGYRTFEFRRPGVFGRIVVGGFGGGQGAEPRIDAQTFLEGPMGKLMRYGLKKKWGIELPGRGRDLSDGISISADLAQAGGKMEYFSKKTGKTFSLTIPPNMKEGQKLRLKGMGEPGLNGGPAGDLYVVIRTRTSLEQKAKSFLNAIRSVIKPPV